MTYWEDSLSGSARKHYELWKKHKKEAERMPEIRIEYSQKFNTCDCLDEEERRCAMPGRLWQTIYGDALFVACKKHGLPLIAMLDMAKEYRKGGVTITGGYDEPKSNLVEARELAINKEYGTLWEVMDAVVSYLEEKERTNDD